jgi:hypothetical protein
MQQVIPYNAVMPIENLSSTTGFVTQANEISNSH